MATKGEKRGKQDKCSTCGHPRYFHAPGCGKVVLQDGGRVGFCKCPKFVESNDAVFAVAPASAAAALAERERLARLEEAEWWYAEVKRKFGMSLECNSRIVGLRKPATGEGQK